MEPEGSLPNSQETCPYPELDQSTPRPLLFIEYPF
jgi:hypothetical protein